MSASTPSTADGPSFDGSNPAPDAADRGIGSGWSTDVQVSRWLAGDEGAFEALYRRFAPLLAYRVRGCRVWHVIERRKQVEDVVQDVWIRAMPALKRSFTPSGPGSFLRFLGKIADRTAVDQARHILAIKSGGGAEERSLDSDHEGDHGRLPRLAELETPSGMASSNELQQILREELTDREHLAWELVERLEYTSEEAGLAMRCPGAAVRGLLYRARVKLVSRLHHEKTG